MYSTPEAEEHTKLSEDSLLHIPATDGASFDSVQEKDGKRHPVR